MKEYLLVIDAPHYYAGAVFINKQCVRAAPIIRWMIHKPPQQIKAYLKKKGYHYQWNCNE